MEQFFAGFTATHTLALGIGIALLFAGRKLYWLALGGIGFFLGIYLADRFLDLHSTGLELGIGFLIGIIGAYLAAAAQRMAISLGGFFIGGSLAYWTAISLGAPLHWQPGMWIWAVTLLGAVIGAFLASLLFETSLVALTSLIGALLIVRISTIGQPHETWLFLILLAIGMIAQSGGQKRRRRRRVAT